MKRRSKSNKRIENVPARQLVAIRGGELTIDEDGFIEEPERYIEPTPPARTRG